MDDHIEVIGPSGVSFDVAHQLEKDYVERISQQYKEDFKFKNIADLQELDRIVRLELLEYRYSTWTLREADYWGGPIESEKLKKQALEISSEIRQLKKDLGINKLNRDKDKGESVAKYIDTLGVRAKEFMYARNEEYYLILDLFQDLIAQLTFYNNADDDERKEYHATKEDVWNWIENVAIPKFQEKDIEFRKAQRAWVRDI